jgi:hypothetical protein
VASRYQYLTSLLMLVVVLHCSATAVCQGLPKGYSRFVVDTSLKSKLAKAKQSLDFDFHMLDDGFWFPVDKKNYKDFAEDADPHNFFDTLETLMEVPCDCMIRKDTVYLQGGIAYEGGAGFDIKIINDMFKGSIWLAGKGYRTDNHSAFKDEIILNSLRQSLKMQDRAPLKKGRVITGEIFMESEPYFEKNHTGMNQFYIKLLFSCKLDDQIVF